MSGAPVLQFPIERWQPCTPRRLRLSEVYRPVRRGSGIVCEVAGCTRKAGRQVVTTGQYLCGEHHAWRDEEQEVQS